MIPYKVFINLDRNSKTPVYLQVVDGIVSMIKKDLLHAGIKILGTRAMAATLKVQRQTIVKAYDELVAQGWIEQKASKGTFIADYLPKFEPDSIPEANHGKSFSIAFTERAVLKREEIVGDFDFIIDEGIPDFRLTPVNTILKYYKQTFLVPTRQYHSYNDVMGNGPLRNALQTYLKTTRSLQFSLDQVLITRGSQMALWLVCQVLLSTGDTVMVGENNYISANIAIELTGARLLELAHDDEGICTEAIAQACAKNKIKALYLTPHHYHPTTVTLSLKRRMEILSLASQYGFMVIEDDYDYEFHYKSKPILPLASIGNWDHLIYIGSFNKSVSPALRVGYLIGNAKIVQEAARYRRVVDRQGDANMEYALSCMIQNGEMDRHIRRVLKVYKERRDLFCSQFQHMAGAHFQFTVPEGGMAVWATLKGIGLEAFCAQLAVQGVYLNNGKMYDHHGTGLNSTRIGFASKNEEEIQLMVSELQQALHYCMPK